MNERYLILPCRNDAEPRTITLRGGKGVYTLNVRIDPSAPRYEIWLPTAFLGEDLTTDLPADAVRVSDRLPDDLYREPLRPAVKFTAGMGWNNDPNGLIFYEGVYHMFFQHNPAGNTWGNMHWGHAVSDDLYSWEERPIALYPDDMGTMFSGSAICDERNVTGLGTAEHRALLLFYTAAGDPFTQCMAWSDDGGHTFHKYEGNPVIPNLAASNRDPKVVWCEELSCYLLAMYLDGGGSNTYVLFRSDDLLHWDELQRIELPGDRECPDLYPLTLRRADGSAERLWVFSGASDRYLLCRIEDGRLKPAYGPYALQDSPVLYAAQTFSGCPDGRIVRVSWDRSDEAIRRDQRWGCSMSVPADMTLREMPDGSVRLCCQPVPEIDAHHTSDVGGAWDIAAVVDAEPGASVTVCGVTIPLEGEAAKGGRHDLRIVCDRLGAELYLDGGVTIAARGGAADLRAPVLTVDRGAVLSMDARRLENAHRS